MRLLVFLALLLPLFLHAQNPRYQVNNYSGRDYGKDRASDNWCITQSDDGILYFGNASGVIEFDGTHWAFIPVKFGSYVISLAAGSDGRIWVGAQGEFGWIEKDSRGELIYKSLSDSLAEEHSFFTNINKVSLAGNLVYFQSEEMLFRYDGNQLLSFSPSTTFHTSFVVGEKFFVRQRDVGLLMQQGNELISADPEGMLADNGIFAMLPYAQNKVLVATHDQGLFLYKGPGAFENFNTPIDSLLRHAGIYGGVKLHDGNFAFATMREGVIIMDPQGNLKAEINWKTGLRSNDVKYVFQDRSNNLWMALSNGLAQAEYGSGISSYATTAGLDGSVRDLIIHHGVFYVATSTGVYRFMDAANTISFVQVDGAAGQFWEFLETGGKLYCAGTNGVIEISGHTSHNRFSEGAYCLASTKEYPIITGNQSGLTFYGKNFQKKGERNIFNVISVLADSVNGSLWVATRDNGLYHLPFPLLETEPDRSFLPEGYESELFFPFIVDGEMVFGSADGVAFIDPTSGLMTWPESYEGVGTGKAINLVYGSAERIWFGIENAPAFIERGKNRLTDKPFRSLETGRINAFLESDGIAWIGTDEGLVRYDTRIESPDPALKLLIRKAESANNGILAANFNKTRDLGKIPFTGRALNIEFVLPVFSAKGKSLYSYQIPEEDTSWTAWSADTRVSINGLSEGSYTFNLRGIDAVGKEAEAVSFSFSIRPPWYRSMAAYLGYVLLFGFLFIGAVRINSSRLRKENLRLEKIIFERTEEVRVKNTDLEFRNQEIAHQKKEITDSIQYAQRIQKALLPSSGSLKEALPGCFVLYLPRDIVSGDFYYFLERDAQDDILLAAADCTGHGVPGGFMSMIGYEKLNESAQQATDPGKILSLLNRAIRKSLRQSESEDATRDGMDIALVRIVKEKSGQVVLQFAGANRPLWIYRHDRDPDAEPEEIRPDKSSIGGLTPDETEFTTHTVRLKSGDTVYMFSDGFPDQFGGPKGKKFSSRQLRNLLKSASGITVTEQESVLKQAFLDWKGEQEQIDDVCLIGFRAMG